MYDQSIEIALCTGVHLPASQFAYRQDPTVWCNLNTEIAHFQF